LKHTPGPWRVGQIEEDGSCWKQLIIAQSPLSKLDISPAEAAGRTRKECDANAHLIAAAPYLYEACKAAFTIGGLESSDVAVMLISAIAQAEGRPL
jgi:hypothetical protein